MKDKSLITLANSRLIRRFMSKALRDYLKFGCAFVQILMNADGSQIVGINTINAKYCRLSMADQNGVITQCVVSGNGRILRVTGTTRFMTCLMNTIRLPICNAAVMEIRLPENRLSK